MSPSLQAPIVMLQAVRIANVCTPPSRPAGRMCMVAAAPPSPAIATCGGAVRWPDAPQARYLGDACLALSISWRAPIQSIATTATDMTDDSLVRAMAQGDADAMARLYDRWSAALFGLALRITREKADAEEVMVDCFAQAWREAARFQADRGSVGAWLATIARSRALDLLRASGRRQRLVDSAQATSPGEAVGMGAHFASPSAHVEHDERSRRVRTALDALPPAQRAALELAYFEGLSQSEIADRLAEPLGTVKTRVRLGLRKLRELLAPFGPLEAS